MNNYIEVQIKTHPIKDGAWVKCIAEIRDNKTGEVREYETNEIMKNKEDHPLTFNWSMGNYSCDCNRCDFFQRANNQDDLDIACSDGLYSVNLKNAKDGKIYYREFE